MQFHLNHSCKKQTNNGAKHWAELHSRVSPSSPTLIHPLQPPARLSPSRSSAPFVMCRILLIPVVIVMWATCCLFSSQLAARSSQLVARSFHIILQVKLNVITGLCRVQLSCPVLAAEQPIYWAIVQCIIATIDDRRSHLQFQSEHIAKQCQVSDILQNTLNQYFWSTFSWNCHQLY